MCVVLQVFAYLCYIPTSLSNYLPLVAQRLQLVEQEAETAQRFLFQLVLAPKMHQTKWQLVQLPQVEKLCIFTTDRRKGMRN